MAATERTRGFTLLELLLAIVIVATALVSLGAVVSSGIGTAADSINQRAAREACRAKLEEVVASGDTSGGGPVEGHDGFQWSLSREERMAGAIDSPDEKYDILTVTVTFPSDRQQQQTAGTTPTPSLNTGPGTASISLSTMVDPPDLQKQQGSAPK